ncbi:hypothetical protein OPQ81_010353 [Rhizoctonia solani]|nr:hypothetical protein OPQ81_010353 [Rhizoctonia solani]
MTDSVRASQTPGAGPSRSSPPEIFAPPQAHLPIASIEVRARTPTRTSTSAYEEVELGLYLNPGDAKLSAPTDKNTPSSGRRGSIGSITSKTTEPGPGFFFNHSIWRTDIITFCSHVRAHPSLSNAWITHIQARKSRRLPFMHEYLLVFFTSPTGQRFVMRIDRLGKVLLGSSGEPMGPATGTGTAIQEVAVYHIQDSHHGVDSNSNVPWLTMDGAWGSHPIVTLIASGKTSENGKHVSHGSKSSISGTPQLPRLLDVSGILEVILLEMPNYHLTTANCYLMTRSSLILLHRCCPTAFACYLGPPSGEPISSALLSEPVWAGLLRCPNLKCIVVCNTGDRLMRAVVYALHSILDVPLPIGIIHSYMTSLEVQVNRLVVNISTQFFRIRNAHTGTVPASTSKKPFEVIVDDAWLVLIGWVVLGGTGGVLIFIATAVDYGILAVFILFLVVGIWFNIKFGSDGPAQVILGQDEDLERLFGPPPVIELPGFE